MIACLDNFWIYGDVRLAVVPLISQMEGPPKGTAAAAH
jgi:hypothetical protein